MRGGKCNMLSGLGCLLLCGSIALVLGNAQKLPKGKRPSLKVHINTTSDSILLKFLRPNTNVKLEGFLLGYGSNVSPNQYFPLPTEGKVTEAVVDAEPKYLIVVRPVPPPSQKKSCSGKSRTRKPLQLVVGTLTPSSVFLSWGFLINPHHDWTLPSHCPNDRFYTIRYREKDKEKKWVFQLCPATETIVDNLKPNTVYEFGVKDNVEGGIWSKIFNHKTIVGSKKLNGKIQSTSDQVHRVPDYVPRKIIPVTIIREVIQNITHRASTKSSARTPMGGTILVHLIIPGLNETTIKLPTSIMFEISDAIKTQLGKNETLALPAESKIPEVEKIPAQLITVIPESAPRTAKPTLPSALDISGTSLAPKRLPEFPQTKTTSIPFVKVGAPSEKTWLVSTAKTSDESKVQQPQTATYDIFSSPLIPDVPEISEPHTATSDHILDSVPPKTSRTFEQPRATLVPSESPRIPQKVEIFTSPELQATTTAPLPTTSIPSTPKRKYRPQAPRTKPERATKPGRVTSKISKSPELTQTTLAPSKTQFISLKPKIPLSTEVTHTTKSVLQSGILETKPLTTLAPEKTKRPGHRPRHKTTPSPDVPHFKPAPKQTPRTPSKQKTSPWPRVPQTQTAPSDVLLPYQPDPDVSQSFPVLQPVTFTIEPPETTIASLETRGSHFIPIISPSPSQEELQTVMEVTDQSVQEHFTTKIPRTTELAKTTQAPHRLYTTPVKSRPDKQNIRPALNRTRPSRPRPSGLPTWNGKDKALNRTRPSRPRPSGLPTWNGKDTGVKQPQKPGGVERNESVDMTHSTKKTATSPGTRHPPMPPRPMPPQRKPLPPNNVNGKPGSAGISSAQVTSPPFKAPFRPTGAPLEKTEKDKKEPTAPASGDLGNITKFSSSPTRETDPLGKPIFTAPHVKYIPKEDDKPCSITESVSWFPTEEATQRNITSPPQNPPTNLTVVTVEGCPSFVILDWEKPKNDTVTEYKVISTENGSFTGKNQSIQITNQTFSTVENLKPDTSYEFQVKPINPLGEGPVSNTVTFNTESADPRVSEPISAGRDAIWTERPFNSDSYSECKGKQYVKRTWYKKFVGVQLCNSLRYKIYLSDSLTGKFYNIGDQRGHGEDHCQFVDSFLDGRTGQQLTSDQLPTKEGYFRAVRQEPVQFGEIGGHTQINYVQWYECGTTIPGKW